MILSIGEILADMIAAPSPSASAPASFARYPGGAPFNLACTLAKLGAPVGFCGCVGDDLVGRYLRDFAAGCGLTRLALQTDPHRNTTLAFVENTPDGERSFCFYRKGTADYHIDPAAIEPLISEASLVHIGSLMLSESAGRTTANRLLAMARQSGKCVSFDVNYRSDIYQDPAEALAITRHYADAADIVKYSEEEAMLLTETASLEEAVDVLGARDAISLITLGTAGSLCVCQGRTYRRPSIPVYCIDTTGAGDAFLAGALSVLAFAESYTAPVIEAALCLGNVCGALTTTRQGAIHHGLTVDAVADALAALASL